MTYIGFITIRNRFCNYYPIAEISDADGVASPIVSRLDGECRYNSFPKYGNIEIAFGRNLVGEPEEVFHNDCLYVLDFDPSSIHENVTTAGELKRTEKKVNFQDLTVRPAASANFYPVIEAAALNSAPICFDSSGGVFGMLHDQAQPDQLIGPVRIERDGDDVVVNYRRDHYILNHYTVPDSEGRYYLSTDYAKDLPSLRYVDLNGLIAVQQDHITDEALLAELHRILRSRLGDEADFTDIYADDADSYIHATEQFINNARQDAENAQQDVDNARQDAENALQDVDNALQDADNDHQDVDNALQDANIANQDVDSAQGEAVNAQQDIDNAQQDTVRSDADRWIAETAFAGLDIPAELLETRINRIIELFHRHKTIESLLSKLSDIVIDLFIDTANREGEKINSFLVTLESDERIRNHFTGLRPAEDGNPSAEAVHDDEMEQKREELATLNKQIENAKKRLSKLNKGSIDDQIENAQARVDAIRKELAETEAELRRLKIVRDEEALKELVSAIANSGKSVADIISIVKGLSDRQV